MLDSCNQPLTRGFSRDGRFSSHGRKIEKAIKLKEKGMPVVIITERTWLKYI